MKCPVYKFFDVVNYFTSFQASTFQPKSAEVAQTDWIEHTAADGRRYFIVIRATGPICIFICHM